MPRSEKSERVRKWEAVYEVLARYLGADDQHKADSYVIELQALAARSLRAEVREETNFARTVQKIVKMQLKGKQNKEAGKTLMWMVRREALRNRVTSAQQYGREKYSKNIYHKRMEQLIEAALKQALGRMGG